MSFLNPLFLFGLAAAAIPILIHLFTRRRPREVNFPSLEFLSEVNQSEIRRLKIKQWLLLLLRTLAIIAIAMAMARPAVRGAAGLTSGAATTVVVLVDRSGSMAADAGANAGAGGRAGDLMSAARRVVEDLLVTLGPADELLLVPYDRAPHPTSDTPLSDLQRLRAATQALESGASTTDHLPALEYATQMLGESRALNRELFWISDFQETGFSDSDSSVAFVAPEGPWAQSRVYLIPLVARTTANVALTDGRLAPIDGGVALSVTATAHDASPGDLAVDARELGTDFELGRGFIDLPATGQAETLLPLARLPEDGGAAEIPDDVLRLDNRRYFAAGRAGTQTVLMREDAGTSAIHLALGAGSPASGLSVESVTPANLPARLADADVLVINDVERLGPTELQLVLDYYRSGGALFLVLGERANSEFWNESVLRELNIGSMGGVQQTTPGAAWRLRRAVAGHAVLAGFPARVGEPLSNAHFDRIRAFEPAGQARTLLQFGPSQPALIEGPHLLVFAGSLEPAASDFPVSGAYLPLLHQAVKVLGRGTAAASLQPGDRYTAPATTGSWRIVDHAGSEVPSELLTTEGGLRLVSVPLETPGLYRVLRAGAVRSTFAVNASASESNLASLPEDALVRAFPAGRARIMRPGDDLAARVREARFGKELWAWFVILALLLLVAESVLARWGMPSRPGEAPAVG